MFFDLAFVMNALSILIPVILVIIITQGYVKAPPDHAFIISGLHREPRILIGRAGLKQKNNELAIKKAELPESLRYKKG